MAISKLGRRLLIWLIVLIALVIIGSFLRSGSRSRAQEIAQTDSEVGTPWTGMTPVRRTTAQLMADDAAHPIDRETLRQTRPLRLSADRENLPQNPFSPATTSLDVAKPLLAPESTSAPQTTGLSFDGATLADTLAFPADTQGAVGPTQFIVAVNFKLRSFNKSTGAPDGVLNVVIDNFFNSVRNGAFLSGPRIRYDRLSQRWFILDVNTQTPNRVVLAVSDTATITGATVWSFYFFQHDLVTPAGNTGQTVDHPTFGIDANALYVGVSNFNVATFTNCTAFVIRKSSVLSGGPIVVTAFRDLIGTDGPYIPQGADNFDAAATEGYFIGVAKNSLGKLILRRVSTPGGTPTLSGNIEITVPATALPLNVPHLGGLFGADGFLDGLDDRLQMAQVRNGHLWTVHNIGVDNTGTAAPGTASRTGSRWYELQNLGATPTVAQSGTLFAPSATNSTDQRNYWMGSIMVSGQGHAAIGASAAGSAERINAVTAGRLATDTPGTLRAADLLTNSSTAYNPNEGVPPGPRRWGRYSYTSVDPNDDMTMWTIQMYCQATDQYATRVVQLLAPPPATPFSTSPATIAPGSASVNVTLTGASVNGSGFFDPGAGFTKHLTASVTGGVTVNSVTYVDPIHVVLNLNTTAALIRKVDITITNPDGQTATGQGVLHVNNGFVRSSHFADFDGDGRSDIGVYRPDAGAWHIVQSSLGLVSLNWGAAGDRPVPADYDGDGCADIAVYRPSTGGWFMLLSATHSFSAVGFGISEDIPAPADFDGDGKADVVVFRPSNGAWYLLQTTAGFAGTTFGTAGDVPVPGYYDSDNKADISVFRPSDGVWYRLDSGNGSFQALQFGQNGDKPVTGDYDGDGRSDLAFFRPGNSTWFTQSLATGLPIVTRQFGTAGDIPAPGDFDGDGKTDTAVYRPSTGSWYIIQSASNSFIATTFGNSTDIPLESAYVP
jgi:hypothetical protein